MYYDPKQMEPFDDMVPSVDSTTKDILNKAIKIYEDQVSVVEAQKITIKHLKTILDEITNDFIVLKRKYMLSLGEKGIAFEKPIKDLDISMRTYNAFRDLRLKTLGDVYVIRKEELLRQRNFGKTSLKEVEELMLSHGLENWGEKNVIRRNYPQLFNGS